MSTDLKDLVVLAYGALAVTEVFAFLPQIWRVWKDNEGAQAISLSAWGYWTLASVISLIYSVAVVAQMEMILVSGVTLAGCVAVYGLALHKRLSWRRSMEAETMQPVVANVVRPASVAATRVAATPSLPSAPLRPLRPAGLTLSTATAQPEPRRVVSLRVPMHAAAVEPPPDAVAASARQRPAAMVAPGV